MQETPSVLSAKITANGLAFNYKLKHDGKPLTASVAKN